jgi:hypothetical protein
MARDDLCYEVNSHNRGNGIVACLLSTVFTGVRNTMAERQVGLTLAVS